MPITCPKCNQTFDFEEKTNVADITPQFSTKELFVSASDGLRMRSSPEKINNDNIIAKLAFSTKVEAVEENGDWFRVNADGKNGWVSKFYLVEVVPIALENLQKKEVFQDVVPAFHNHEKNLATDANSIKLRKIINDEFGGGARRDDLQCVEYVHYKIQQMGITIKWPAERPRNGGLWAGIFQRSAQYRILEEPKAGCAMSFVGSLKNPAVGHVAFVEEVYQDGSIKISEVNWPPPGVYSERVISKSQWKDKYQAKFIDFT
ncbi:MAG: CHAP domain-containing protein [Patescibacteria group bacterium]|nr:CHAP domain-containing protein [Patescibacteria group bacterium]